MFCLEAKHLTRGKTRVKYLVYKKLGRDDI